MIQEALRANIESKLTNNTLGKQFIVGQFVRLDDKEKDFIYNVSNGYTLIETDYIPVMMNMTATYQAIPTQINGLATINLMFLLQSENKAVFDASIGAMDEFVAKVVGNFEELVDGSTTYNTVWNMDAFMPSGRAELLNGIYYTPITTTVYVDFSDTNHYGNEYRYYLNNDRIYPYSINIQRQNEEDLPHKLGDTEAKGGNKTSTWQGTLTVYVDDVISAIVDELSSGSYDMNTIYKFTEITPSRGELEFSVRIQSAVYNPELGVKTFASITFIKSDEDYTEPIYTITYTLNGGINNILNPATFTFDDLPITLEDPTRAGYEFDGWYSDSGLTTPITSITVIGNDTVYAGWNLLAWGWELTDETYWNNQLESNRGTSALLAGNDSTPPSELATNYAYGFAMRVLYSQEPDLYSYWKVAVAT